MTVAYHHALPSGTRIASYEIRGILGVGGFGITYKAYDRDLDREVAIKEYLPTGLAVRAGDGTTVTPKSEGDTRDFRYGLKRFLDEARTLARFREPNVVRVIAYLESYGTAYFVMDYEEGESLAERLKTAVTLPEATVRAIAVPILRGLAAIHEQHFLHRDIKPQNIYLRRDGTPVLLDFGAARQALGEHSRAMTGLVTPGYAPFEQYLSGDKQGPWSDIYAIGATMYHCIVGVAPIVATERVAAIHDGKPDPLLRVSELLANQYSGVFLDAMQWMLAPMPKDRPQSVAEALGVLADESPGVASARTKPSRPQTHSSDSVPTAAGKADGTGSVAWQPETLKAVELSLEQRIGPMSRVLIQKAAARTHSIEEMTQLLSRFIPNEHDKTEFVAHTRALSADTWTKPDTGTTPRTAGTTSPPAMNSGAVALDAHILRAAEHKLATYVGPVAKVLVRKAQARAGDVQTFYQLLAQELSTEEARSAFLKDVEKL